MKYLCFIRHSESHRASPPPAALLEAMGKFVESSRKDGTLVDTGGLLPSKEGFLVRLADGKITVTDGPFTESKELISYALYEVRSKEEAIEWASRFLKIHRDHWAGWAGTTDIHQVMDPASGPPAG